ncbi:metallophosphoesterase [Acaryochloris sp. IP29b_bin.148]|uniref:metallophosphoesterase n=1 Tax=Acaryochloris sp. IP29b_bin.148 TaxID=2969218 RepID=UPI002624B702|nr:metallophosphoesterase [Acaryochloris sp. IP29b_bin.148]
MTTPESRRFVIGDVHGHYQGLLQLISLLELDAADQVFFLGDLIDRGPNSSKIVDFVIERSYSCLLGNHEQLMVSALANANLSSHSSVLQMWLQAGGSETLQSYSSKQHLWQHLAWFKTLPSYLDLGDYWLVHAGLHPDLPLENQTAQEFCWIRREFHHMSAPYFSNKQIITGHTMTFTFPGVEPGQLVQGAGWLDIDTGAYHPMSGWLTALELSSLMVYQINVHRDTTRVHPLSEVVVPLEFNPHSASMSIG